jgi:CubicO group peptidase (beta-lactamase class C family)
MLVMLTTPAVAPADASLQAFLEQGVASMRERAQAPAVAALVQKDGEVVAEVAVGLRAEGHPEMVTTHDRWHIGSCTKAFTATMIARLVEQRVMRFEDTLAESLPQLAKDMNPAYRGITVFQLLSHTHGGPAARDRGRGGAGLHGGHRVRDRCTRTTHGDRTGVSQPSARFDGR